MSKNDYIKAGIWYTVGNIIIKGLPFFSIPIFVRLLTTSDFGIYNTYIYYESIISIILGLGISGTVKTAKYEYKEIFNQYISSVYVLLLGSAIILGISSTLLYQYIHIYVYWLTWPIVFALLVHSFVSAIYSINGVKYVIEGKYKQNLIITLTYTLLNIGLSLCLIFFVFDDIKYIGRIAGTIISMIVVSVTVIFIQVKKEKPQINKVFWKYALKMGTPLVPHLLSLLLLSSCDTIMIQSMIGSEEAGIYSLAVNLIMVLGVLQNSIENAWSPWFYSSLDKKKYNNINKGNNALVVLFAYITVCFMMMSPEIISVFSTPEYKDSVYVLIPLSISYFWGFIYLIPVNVEYFYKKTVYISIATIVTSFLNIFLNYYFLNQWGYIAAAYATCISRLVLLLFHIIVSKKLNDEICTGGIYGVIASVIVILFGFGVLFCLNLWMLRWGGVLLFTMIAGIVAVKYNKLSDRGVFL